VDIGREVMRSLGSLSQVFFGILVPLKLRLASSTALLPLMIAVSLGPNVSFDRFGRAVCVSVG
jgi:hypothetical protein